MRAASNDLEESIHVLIEMGANINQQDIARKTAAHYAVGHIKALSALLSYPNLDVNRQDNEGNTILHLAAYQLLWLDIEMIIKRHDLKPNLQSHDGRTALHYATQKNVIEHNAKKHIELLRSLSTLDPQIKDHTGRAASDYKEDSLYTFDPPVMLLEKIERDLYGVPFGIELH
jgi:hypothetical protein